MVSIGEAFRYADTSRIAEDLTRTATTVGAAFEDDPEELGGAVDAVNAWNAPPADAAAGAKPATPDPADPAKPGAGKDPTDKTDGADGPTDADKTTADAAAKKKEDAALTAKAKAALTPQENAKAGLFKESGLAVNPDGSPMSDLQIAQAVKDPNFQPVDQKGNPLSSDDVDKIAYVAGQSTRDQAAYFAHEKHSAGVRQQVVAGATKTLVGSAVDAFKHHFDQISQREQIRHGDADVATRLKPGEVSAVNTSSRQGHSSRT